MANGVFRVRNAARPENYVRKIWDLTVDCRVKIDYIKIL